VNEEERLEELIKRYPKLDEIQKNPDDWAELLKLVFRPSPEPVPSEIDSSAQESEILPKVERHDVGFGPFEETLLRSIGKLDVICSWICLEDGWQYVSPAFERLSGYTSDEIIGMGQGSPLGLFTPDDHASLVRLTRARMLGKPPTELAMYRVLHKDGSLVFCLGSALGTKHNGRNALVGVSVDITERVKTQMRLKQALEGSINAMALTVETRDPYTAGHQKRVAELATAIATEMQVAPETVEGIRMAGVIHDLGKLRVPPDILSNPGRLTEPEFAIIKTHPQVAHDILSVIDFPWPVSEVVYQHHERIDGSGYPQGLEKDEILIEARIIGVADVVEAMASHRPYRPALGVEKALKEIREGSGTRYDSSVASACLGLFESKAYSLPDLTN
jgi:PAS domain S-box-containing protein